MNQTMVLELCRSILVTAITVSAPILLVGMVIGILVSLFQAVTTVHEQTMAQIPRMFAVGATTLFLLPWIIRVLVGYSVPLFQSLPQFAK